MNNLSYIFTVEKKDIANILTLDTQYVLYVEQEELPRIIFDQNTKCIVNNGVLISLGGKKGANEEKRDNYIRKVN
jgi:hypothetical protein